MLHVDRQGGTWRLLGSVVFIHRQVGGLRGAPGTRGEVQGATSAGQAMRPCSLQLGDGKPGQREGRSVGRGRGWQKLRDLNATDANRPTRVRHVATVLGAEPWHRPAGRGVKVHRPEAQCRHGSQAGTHGEPSAEPGASAAPPMTSAGSIVPEPGARSPEPGDARSATLTRPLPALPPGAHHHLVYRLPGPHLLLLLRVPGREGRRERVGPSGVWQLRGCPVVGGGKWGQVPWAVVGPRTLGSGAPWWTLYAPRMLLGVSRCLGAGVTGV